MWECLLHEYPYSCKHGKKYLVGRLCKKGRVEVTQQVDELGLVEGDIREEMSEE